MEPSAERFRRTDEIFHLLLGLPASEREGALARECDDDAELEADVRALLAAEDGSAGFIEAAIGGEAQRVAGGGARIGDVVGVYRLTGELGRGGMGMVYRAERADDQYRATVAVKFLAGGRGDPELFGKDELHTAKLPQRRGAFTCLDVQAHQPDVGPLIQRIERNQLVPIAGVL